MSSIEHSRTPQTHNAFLLELRTAVPFLQEVPDERYFGLSLGELRIPKGELAQARVDLEEELDQNVITYYRDVFRLDAPLKSHLCANLVGAELTKEQVGRLQDYEKRFAEQNVSFVVFQRPVKLMDPAASALARLYRAQLEYSNPL